MSRKDTLPIGKLNFKHLEELLSTIPVHDKRVFVGPKFGEDAAVIDFGDAFLIAKTDPITFATDQIGWYAVTINANDIAVMGGTPKWFLATLLLPERKTDRKLVNFIFKDILTTCKHLGITLCGGHTEVTYGLRRPLVIGLMLGEARKDKLVKKSNIRVGDQIILTKGIAIEGTAIIAREKEPALKQKFPSSFIAKAKGFLFNPGISVLKDALIANRTAPISSMHDPTEGGLRAGLYEMAKAGNVGLVIYEDAITILKETRVLCEELNLDPLGLIASGALLIAASRSNALKVINALDRGGISASIIGEVVAAQMGLYIQKKANRKRLMPPPVDEITKIFRKANHS